MKSRRGWPRSARGADWRVQAQGASVVLTRRGGPAGVAAEWFRDSYWRERDLVVGEERGRGAVLFVKWGGRTWVLRHYRRGGAVARLTADRYLWTGLERTRAFREWRLLRDLYDSGLPVPNPVAAHVSRTGLAYRGDLLTERIADAQSMAALVVGGGMDGPAWEAVGAVLRRFHEHGVDHADLNAHNVLLDRRGCVFLVDFDRGAIRSGAIRSPPIRSEPGWTRRNLDRLRRSLRKISSRSGAAFGRSDWRRLLRGYRSRA